MKATTPTGCWNSSAFIKRREINPPGPRWRGGAGVEHDSSRVTHPAGPVTRTAARASVRNAPSARREMRVHYTSEIWVLVIFLRQDLRIESTRHQRNGLVTATADFLWNWSLKKISVMSVIVSVSDCRDLNKKQERACFLSLVRTTDKASSVRPRLVTAKLMVAHCCLPKFSFQFI